MKYIIDIQVIYFDYSNSGRNADIDIRVLYTVGSTTKSDEYGIEFKKCELQIVDFIEDNWIIHTPEFAAEMTAALSIVESWKEYLND
jgi:hypothetical protein